MNVEPRQLCKVLARSVMTDEAFALTLEPSISSHPPFLPGQYLMLSAFGACECPISLCGDPEDSLYHVVIKEAGNATKALKATSPQDPITIRGPYGKGWPVPDDNSHILLIAGGIGMATLRSTLFSLAKRRSRYQSVTLIYGCREPTKILFHSEWRLWQQKGIDVFICVDTADTSWQGLVGVVPQFLHHLVKDPKNTFVMACGPEVMLKAACYELMHLGALESKIFLSLERHMQCSEGYCGRCQLGPYLLCKDGPVLPLEKLKPWLYIEEL